MELGSLQIPPSPLRILARSFWPHSGCLGVGSWCRGKTFNIIYLIPPRSRSHCKTGIKSKIPPLESKASRSHPQNVRFYKSKDTFWAEKRLATFGKRLVALFCSASFARTAGQRRSECGSMNYTVFELPKNIVCSAFCMHKCSCLSNVAHQNGSSLLIKFFEFSESAKAQNTFRALS